MKTILALSFLLASCATTAPIPLVPEHRIPPDIVLLCWEGSWAIASNLAQQGVVFDKDCIQA